MTTKHVAAAASALEAAEADLTAADDAITEIQSRWFNARALVDAYARMPGVEPREGGFYGTSHGDSYGRSLAQAFRDVGKELERARETRQELWRARNAAERQLDAMKSVARRGPKAQAIAADTKARESRKVGLAQAVARREAELRDRIKEGQPALARLRMDVAGLGSRLAGRS